MKLVLCRHQEETSASVYLVFNTDFRKATMTQANSLGAQSMHGLMKTFDNDVDVINDDSSVSSRHNSWH